MKAKTIKSVIRKKINEWLESIEDESVRVAAAENTIVTGGCIASMLLQEKVNDFDLYFRNKLTAQIVAEYYLKRFEVKSREGIDCAMYVESAGDRVKIVIKSAGIASEEGTEKQYEYFEQSARAEDAGEYVGEIMNDPGEIEELADDIRERILDEEDMGEKKHRPIFLSTNAITLSGKIQIVLRFFGEPDKLHENYDFVHCTNYWTSWNDELVLRPKALECLLSRELVYIGSKYPICSLFRLRKFIKRHWTINAGQILKICLQVSELDLKDIDVLEDQLTGVDCAYFIEVISKLRDKDPEKVNSAYLVEIIDRMC